MYSNQWFYTHYSSKVLTCIFAFVVLTSSSTSSIYSSIYRGCILNTFFYCWNNLRMSLFLSFLWLFFFWTPSFKVLWFFCLYICLLSYSIIEVLWFLSLHFLILNCSTKHCFNLLILAQYLCIYWIPIDKIWIFKISFQLVLHNSFISSMLSLIILQLLCKIFLCNLPPFLRFSLKILDIVFCPH